MKIKVVLAIVLSISLLATGCSAQWISVALADLPVLTQMALNIGSLVVTLQSGQQINPADAANIQKVSDEATKDLNLLQSLYAEYQANSNPSTLAKIQSAVNDINTNLPALLAATHVSDPILQARVEAGVKLILATVTSFAALIPASKTAQTSAKLPAVKLPSPKQLRDQWNSTVCGVDPCKVKLPGAFSQLKSGIGTGLGEAFGHR